MKGRHVPAQTGAEAARFVRALGNHRYVAGKLHLVHALAFQAVDPAGLSEGSPLLPLSPACAWARDVLADPTVEADSKDPRLVREASNDELALLLEVFWGAGPSSAATRERLVESAKRLGMEAPAHTPFDESAEDEMHPLLVDAGWELLPLGRLDPERHRGVIEAYGEPLLFEAARFEEENAIPPRVLLQELPALGLVELTRAVDDDGALVEPLVLWTEGDEVYQDYLLRGVAKAAKLTG